MSLLELLSAWSSQRSRLLLREDWGLSLHDAIFNDEIKSLLKGVAVRVESANSHWQEAKYLLVFGYYLFSFKFTCSQLDIQQHGYVRAVSRGARGRALAPKNYRVINAGHPISRSRCSGSRLVSATLIFSHTFHSHHRSQEECKFSSKKKKKRSWSMERHRLLPGTLRHPVRNVRRNIASFKFA